MTDEIAPAGQGTGPRHFGAPLIELATTRGPEEVRRRAQARLAVGRQDEARVEVRGRLRQRICQRIRQP